MKTNRFLLTAGLALALLCISAHAQPGANQLAEQLRRSDSLSAKRIPSPLAPVVTVEEAQRRWGSAPTPRPPSGNPSWRQQKQKTGQNAYQALEINKLNIRCFYERKPQTFEIEHDGYVTVRGTWSSKTWQIDSFMEPIINPRAAAKYSEERCLLRPKRGPEEVDEKCVTESLAELREIMTSEATKKQIMQNFGTIIGSESNCDARIGEPE